MKKGTVNPRMKPVERLLVHMACFERGIVPIENAGVDVNVTLSQLPPEEARRIKRRFRKLWRREVRHRRITRFGRFGNHPTRVQKIDRKIIVMRRLYCERIEPILQRIENPSED